MTSSSSTNEFSDAPDPVASLEGDRPTGRSRSGRRRRGHGAGALTTAGLVCCVAVVVAAPILVGGVHRATMTVLMTAGLIGLAVFAVGLALQKRGPRLGIAVLAPLAFVLVPLLQSVPIPLAARKAFDRSGTALLRDNQVVPTSSWPLSLDPPNTRVDVGRAALALVAFLVAFQLASGQRRRHLLTHAIGLTGILAVAIGLGHRILGIEKLYGTFNTQARSLLIGPFVNNNHNAEFLELSAFVCLACSFQRPTALNRIGWLLGTLLCAGGAAATMSRGAVAALTMAVVMFVFLRYFSLDGGVFGRRRAALAWGALLLGLVVISAGALGAGQLVDRFRADAVTTDVRLKLWREGMRVFAAHPFGIGRGAFDRVFPLYRSFKMPFPLRFAFIENEPLQLLIDCGWFFLLLIAGGLAVAVWKIVRQGRRDKIEAALIAGLFAVLVHSAVDFGLETLGVLLPFAAILGTVLGRLRASPEQSSVALRARWGVVVFAGAAVMFGIVSTAHSSYDNFDALLKKRMPPAERRALLVRAEATHPLDYYYALGEARLDPLKSAPGTPSPRLHALNRALRLCPSCEATHAEIARNLWGFGQRRQALLEWRTAVELQPEILLPTLGEIFRAGATAQELASVATFDPARMLDAAQFLTSMSRFHDAIKVLGQAEILGAPRNEVLFMRARLHLQTGNTVGAAASLSQAHAAGFRDVRLPLLDAQLMLATGGASNADPALAILDQAATQYPSDLAVQRARLDLVTTYAKWQAADRTVEGLKQALYHNQLPAAEAHLANARILTRLGRWTNALGEYRLALADAGSEIVLWMEYGHAAEAAGRDATARDAYATAARLSPNNPEVTRALGGLDERRAKSSAPSPLNGLGGPR